MLQRKTGPEEIFSFSPAREPWIMSREPWIMSYGRKGKTTNVKFFQDLCSLSAERNEDGKSRHLGPVGHGQRYNRKLWTEVK
jgi:hypothetical protein